MPNAPTMTVRIAALKAKMGIRSNDKMAAKLGCSRAMLYLYESGKNPAPEKLMERLAALERDAGLHIVGNQEFDTLGNQAASEVADDGDEVANLKRRVDGLKAALAESRRTIMALAARNDLSIHEEPRHDLSGGGERHGS